MVSHTFYPNFPIFLHGYIRHIRDILQLWYYPHPTGKCSAPDTRDHSERPGKYGVTFLLPKVINLYDHDNDDAEAVTPGLSHFGAYHRSSDGNF